MGIIDDYIAKYKPSICIELERIRSITKSALPEYEETISYGMPTIKCRGKSIVGFDAHNKHIGIYPFSGHVIAKIDALKNYETTKGAIHEKLDQLLPDDLIREIVHERMKQAGI